MPYGPGINGDNQHRGGQPKGMTNFPIYIFAIICFHFEVYRIDMKGHHECENPGGYNDRKMLGPACRKVLDVRDRSEKKGSASPRR